MPWSAGGPEPTNIESAGVGSLHSRLSRFLEPNRLRPASARDTPESGCIDPDPREDQSDWEKNHPHLESPVECRIFAVARSAERVGGEFARRCVPRQAALQKRD